MLTFAVFLAQLAGVALRSGLATSSETLLETLSRKGKINWNEGFADGTFASAKKRGDFVGKTKRGKGNRIMVLSDGNGLPFAVDVDSANCAEVNLIERLLDSAFTDYVPNKLIYNKAADSDKLRDRLADRNVELICPHRRGRVRPSRHHRRVLRRYQDDGKSSKPPVGSRTSEDSSRDTNFVRSSSIAFAWIASLMMLLRRF